MEKGLLLLPLVFFIGCSDVKEHNLNTAEPTLQSAEDANTKKFTEESFK